MNAFLQRAPLSAPEAHSSRSISTSPSRRQFWTVWEYSELFHKLTFIAIATCEFYTWRRRQSQEILVRLDYTLDVFYPWSELCNSPHFWLGKKQKAYCLRNFMMGVTQPKHCCSSCSDVCFHHQLAELLWEHPEWEHPVAVCPFPHPATLWHVAEGF